MASVQPSFSRTLTGILGVPRDTMLNNELHLKDRLAKSKPRGYSKPFPGNNFIYGIPYPTDTGNVNDALHGWPGLDSSYLSREKKIKTERDFINMNRYSIEAGMVTVPQQDQWRLTHDIRRRIDTNTSGKTLKPLRLPPNMVYGMATRPTTPFFDLIEHKYQDQWIKERRALEKVKRKEAQTKKAESCNISETRASILRAYQPPVEPEKLWHMKRWSSAEPNLRTFRTDAHKDKAFASFESNKNARQGTKQGGIYNKAQDFNYLVK